MAKTEVAERENLAPLHQEGQTLPAMTSKQFQEMWEDFQQFVRESLEVGTDYGHIPNVSRPTLLQPGAQKISSKYFARPDYEILGTLSTQDFEKGLIAYAVRCHLINMATGKEIGQGLGTCNSWEVKYRYVWVWQNQLGNKKPIEEKKFKSSKGQWHTKYKIERDDVAEIQNTILKMACKRALVAAAVTLGCASGMFTQDVEEMEIGNEAPAPAEEKSVSTKEQPTKPTPREPASPATELQIKKIWACINELTGLTKKGKGELEVMVKKAGKVEHLSSEHLTAGKASNLIEWLEDELKKLRPDENE